MALICRRYAFQKMNMPVSYGEGSAGRAPAFMTKTIMKICAEDHFMDVIVFAKGLWVAGYDQNAVNMGIRTLLRALNKALYFMHMQRVNRLVFTTAHFLLFFTATGFRPGPGSFMDVIICQGGGTMRVLRRIALMETFF